MSPKTMPQKVSVIIPVKEINYYLLHENFPLIDRQSYQNFEVIVLPNTHTPYDLELLKTYKWLRIIPTGKVTRPAEKRDIGVKHAEGKIIAFIDDDAYPTNSWLRNAVAIFQQKKVAAVCGPGLLPEKTNIWEKIFDEVLKTKIGSGGYSYRFMRQPARYVDDYPSMNFLVNKSIFEKIGGFHTEYWPGEDSKLCNDIVYKENQKIYYDPSVAIYHHRRTRLKDFLRQHANYGFHRGAFFGQGDNNSQRFTYLIPAIFTLYIISFLILLMAQQVLNLPHFLYILLTLPALLYAVGELYLFLSALINTHNVFIAGGAVLTLLLTHIIYGIMFIHGYIRALNQQKHIYGSR